MNIGSWMPWNWFPTAVVTDQQTRKPQTDDVTQRQDYYAWMLQQGLPYQPGFPVVGYSQVPATGWATYRYMLRSWPTISLAYCMKRSSVISVPYTIESDKDGKEEAKELIEKTFLDKSALIPLLCAMYRSIVMRNAPIAVIWGVEDGYQVPVRFKPLLPEFTQVLIDGPGEIVGVRNGDVDLTGPNYLLHVNEPDTMPVYGWSLLENLREQWWQWMENRQRAGQLNNKGAGVVFVVMGPDGSVMYTDSEGRQHKASTLAKRVANGLMQMVSQYLPNQMTKMRAGSAEDMAKLAATSDFNVQHFDLGNVGPAQEALLKDQQYLDSLGFRGLYLPERSGLEGQHGTKAEAETHSGVVEDQCALDRLFLASGIQHAIDWTLELNFGPNERGKHRLVPAPVVDNDISFLRDTGKLLIQNGQAGIVARMMQMSGFFNKVGWPINEDMTDEIDDPDEWKPEPAPNHGLNGNHNSDEPVAASFSRMAKWLKG